jgi:serine/threonine protein kinase
LLQALLHLQKKGVAHRDLSLENLLVDANNNLVVVDFGLSLRVPFTDMSNYGGVSDVSEGTTRRLMKAQGQSGSLTYLAPEIIERDEAFDGFATDLWSAGVILFVFLVGLAPFKWPHPTDYRYAQINKGKLRELMKKLNKPVSDEATDLLQNMLWRDPRKRLCLAQVLTHPWVVGPPEKRGSSTTPQVVGTTENSSPTNRALPRIVSEELVGKSTPKHHPMARHTTTRLAF